MGMGAHESTQLRFLFSEKKEKALSLHFVSESPKLADCKLSHIIPVILKGENSQNYPN